MRRRGYFGHVDAVTAEVGLLPIAVANEPLATLDAPGAIGFAGAGLALASGAALAVESGAIGFAGVALLGVAGASVSLETGTLLFAAAAGFALFPAVEAIAGRIAGLIANPGRLLNR